MTSSCLVRLQQQLIWEDLLEELEAQGYRKRRLYLYAKELIETGAYKQVVQKVLTASYEFAPPLQTKLNRRSGKKKIVYRLQDRDLLLCKVVQRIVQESFSHCISSSCYSFQKGKSARTAFHDLLRVKKLPQLSSLHLDIRNYFNSIQPAHLLATLPEEMRKDAPLFSLLTRLLRGDSALVEGKEEKVDSKGVMAGTPLAPFLANLYLRELDEKMRGMEFVYARYADDMLLLGEEEKVKSGREVIQRFIEKRGLMLNQEKTRFSKPGEGWVFLGFLYRNGEIDMSEHSFWKLKRKVRRLARKYKRLRGKKGWRAEKACYLFLRKLNSRLYGSHLKENRFCWARWFFPLLTTTKTLCAIDEYVQERARVVASGREGKRKYKAMSYSHLKEMGYYPLASAYYAHRKGGEKFLEKIEARTERGRVS